MFDTAANRRRIQERAKRIGVKVRFLKWMTLSDIAVTLAKRRVADDAPNVIYQRLLQGAKRGLFTNEYKPERRYRWWGIYEDARDWYRQTWGHTAQR